MAKLLGALAFILFVAVSSARQPDEYHDFKQLMKLLSKPRVLDRQVYTNQILKEPGYVQSVQWKNCGASSDPMQIKALSLNPDPVKLPGNISVSFAATTSTDLDAPIKVELTIKKKILFWIEIPCVDNIGSCTYNDVCALLKTISCPPQFAKAGIRCQCPYKKGSYALPKTLVTIPPVGLPTWLENGDYQVTAKLSNNGQPLGCLFIQLSLTK